MRHVQVRLEDGEYKAFKEKADGAGFDSLQAAARQAVLTVDWGESGPHGSIPAKLRPYMDKLAEILSSGDGLAIEAVTKNIELFRDRLKPAGGRKSR